MKTLFLSSLLTMMSIGILATGASEPTNTIEAEQAGMIAIATVREHAAVVGSELDLELKDHYGNPDQFIQYIIRIPPVHA